MAEAGNKKTQRPLSAQKPQKQQNQQTQQTQQKQQEGRGEAARAKTPTKYGTFVGVFTPSILTTLGVIMYLRFDWVVGNAGVAGALVILGVSLAVMMPTVLSVASIATNRTVRAGGDYYMISRSLGLEVGGAIGLSLFFAQAISVALYILGFTEALKEVFPGLIGPLGSLTTTFLLAILVFWNTSIALKSQYIIMALIAASLISVFAGPAHGGAGAAAGAAGSHAVSWWGSTVGGKSPEAFSVVFAVFFPSVTGFTQGVSMSGDLENPRKSIPAGTFAAVAVATVIYLALIVWLAMRGDPQALRDPARITLKEISRWGFLVTGGIFAATLSSAIGRILGAPRILQALARDRVVPQVLGRGHGPDDMPRNATLVSLVVAMVGLFIGHVSASGLNAVAMVMSMFFLASYGFLNLACGLAAWSQTPSFRPSFRVPAAVSILGALACFYMMSLINLPAMIAALMVMGAIFFLLQRQRIAKTWGDMRHGIWAALVRKGLSKLKGAQYHPINWQPHIIVMGGSPVSRPHLLMLASWVGGQHGLVTYFCLLRRSQISSLRRRRQLEATLADRIGRDSPGVFTKVEICEDIFSGALSAAQIHGLSGFEPNTVAMGWCGVMEHAKGFVELVRNLIAEDKCLIFVSHRDDLGFGEHRSIDIWWRGLENNGGFMLLIATLLTEEEGPWKGAKVRVKMIVDESSPQSTIRKNLEKIISAARIPAEAEVIVRKQDQGSVSDLITQHSKADLVMLGLRAPAEGEDPEAYVLRTNDLLNGLPTSIVVRSSKDFEGAEMLFEQEYKAPRRPVRPLAPRPVEARPAREPEADKEIEALVEMTQHVMDGKRVEEELFHLQKSAKSATGATGADLDFSEKGIPPASDSDMPRSRKLPPREED